MPVFGSYVSAAGKIIKAAASNPIGALCNPFAVSRFDRVNAARPKRAHGMEFGDVVDYGGFRILAHRQAAGARMRRREFITYIGATAAVPLAALTRAEGGNANMAVPVGRISFGTFDADKAAIVEAKLMESKTALEAGIRAMRGNLGYYVGIDRRTTQSRTSVFGRALKLLSKWQRSSRCLTSQAHLLLWASAFNGPF